MMDLEALGEAVPRTFAIVYELSDDHGVSPGLVGWGWQLTDRTVFVWRDVDETDRSAVGFFSTPDRVLWMVELVAPARLVWMAAVAPVADTSP